MKLWNWIKELLASLFPPGPTDFDQGYTYAASELASAKDIDEANEILFELEVYANGAFGMTDFDRGILAAMRDWEAAHEPE